MTGPLRNPRHERLAQALAKGATATVALAEAGYTDPRNSTRLTKNDEIRSRVAELQERAAAKALVTVDDLVRDLDETRAMAHQKGQASAAVAATMGKAKILGFLVDHVVADVKHSFTDLADDELDREIRALAQEAGGKLQDTGLSISRLPRERMRAAIDPVGTIHSGAN
jgi:hypothetical protein